MYKKILVPLDGSDTAERGLKEAMRLAGGSKSELVLLHVIDNFPMLVELASFQAYEKAMEHLRVSGRRLLESAQQTAVEAGISAQTRIREITRGRVGQAILDEVRDSGCDMIVMGTHGRRGVNRILIGSDAEFVVRASPVPVLLVRAALNI